MIQDPAARANGVRAFEETLPEWDDYYLDGPVTSRIAILDFDDKTGELLTGAVFRPGTAQRLGGFDVPKKDGQYEIYSPAFIQVSVLTTVRKTMEMFEADDALGRPLEWAFDAPQLLVVPRAGDMMNAYYERESHSLQFFYFTNHEDKTIYTALSRDIVSHETAHAILDGIAPDLYNAITPQSLALHEAIADLTAALTAFRSRHLTRQILDQGGSIKAANAFSSVAEEFGLNRNPEASIPYLRSLLNERTLDTNDTSLDENGVPNLVKRYEPHALSEVLSGALYKLLIDMHEREKARLLQQPKHQRKTDVQVSGRALFIVRERFKRMIYRGLDYLPPGEITFADYGRAIIASDQASHPDQHIERELIRAEFYKRRMAEPGTLTVRDPFAFDGLNDVNLQTLTESDWAAYEFANRYREFLGIPEGLHFRVRPRLDVTKTYWQADGQEKIRECIFKVSWDLKEPNQLGPRFPAERQVTVGTILAIDWNTKQVRALLTSDAAALSHTDTQPPPSSLEGERDRNQALQWLVDSDALRVGQDAVGPDGKWLKSVVRAEAMEGLMRLRATARMLHIARAV